MRRIVAAVITLLLAGAALAAPVRTHYDPAFYRPSEEVVTPHIPWAKPYARGPVKALFLVNRQNQREVIELAERLDMKYTVFCCEDATKFGETGIGVDMGWRLVEGNSAEELTKQLREVLKPDYDVIVVGSVKWDEFPIDCRYEILKKVKAGTGLVGYMPNGHDQYLQRIMANAKFSWTYGNWSGAAQGVPDYFGIGDFVGSVDTQEKHSGECSVRVTGREVKQGSREPPRGGYMVAPIKVEPHTKYHFSAWYKNDATGRAGISLHPMPASVDTRTSETWRQTEVTWDTGDMTEFGVYLLDYSVGSVWFDDVSLTKVGDDTNLLPNPGFEFPGPAPACLNDAFPYPSLPAFRSQASPDAFSRSLYATTRFGKGRVCLLQGIGVPGTQAMTPGPQGPMRTGQIDYDYYLLAAIRAILWGANKEPEVSIRTDAAQVTLTRAELATKPITFHLASATPGEYGYILRVHDRTGRAWPGGAGMAKLAGEKGFDIAAKLQALPAGSYFVDLSLIPGKEVSFAGVMLVSAPPTMVNSASVGLEVTSPVRIGKLELAKDAFSMKDPVAGTATVVGARPGLALRLEAFDNLGRQLASTQVPAAQEQVPFSVKTLPACAILGRLRATLLSGTEALDVQEAGYSLTDFYPDTKDLRHVVWTSPGNDYVSPYVLSEFRKAGVDTQYTNYVDMITEANLWHIPYVTRFVDAKTDWYNPKPSRTKDDLVRDPCLTDPAYLGKLKGDLTKNAEQVRKFSTLDFSLGDECLFVNGNYDLCMSPTCNADFREFLKREYGDLDKVNAEWGTGYKTWEEVVPITLEEAKKTGRIPQWIDHRRHMESVWAGIYGYSRDVIRQTVPQARVGYEGSDTEVGSFHANDYWKLAQAMDFNNIYYRDFLTNAVRDFSPPQMLLGAGWYGGYASNRNAPFMHWFPWRALFKGSNSLWIWMGYGTAGSVMAPDLSLYPFYKVNCAEVNEIKSGPGKLLTTAKRQHDGIALLWSASSVHVATTTDGFPNMDEVLNNLVRIIHDIGLECKVVSYEQLAKGEITNQEFRVLILPCAQAMSHAECDAVRKFAAAGGRVLADLRPAVCDEHGKPYPQGQLDDLFGVKQDTGKLTKATGDLTIPPNARTELPIGLTLKGLTVDAGLQVAGGDVLAKVAAAPVCVGRESDRGKLVALLNFALTGYGAVERSAAKGAEFSGWAAGAPMRRFLSEVLGFAGVKPTVRVAPELPQVEISRFRSGDAEYVGIVQGLPRDPTDYTNLLAKAPEGKQATIALPRTGHVYDVRAGQYLGQTSTVKTTITPGIAKLYALLPYKVDGIRVSATTQVQRGAALAYSCAVVAGANTPAGAHVLHVEVRGPDGKARDCYAANLEAPGGRATGNVVFALNDTPGTWKLIFRDVASGVINSQVIGLR